LCHHLGATVGISRTLRVSAQANVLLLDDSNFCSYKRGRQFRDYGSLAKQTPMIHL